MYGPNWLLGVQECPRDQRRDHYIHSRRRWLGKTWWRGSLSRQLLFSILLRRRLDEVEGFRWFLTLLVERMSNLFCLKVMSSLQVWLRQSMKKGEKSLPSTEKENNRRMGREQTSQRQATCGGDRPRFPLPSSWWWWRYCSHASDLLLVQETITKGPFHFELFCRLVKKSKTVFRRKKEKERRHGLSSSSSFSLGIDFLLEDDCVMIPRW